MATYNISGWSTAFDTDELIVDGLTYEEAKTKLADMRSDVTMRTNRIVSEIENDEFSVEIVGSHGEGRYGRYIERNDERD